MAGNRQEWAERSGYLPVNAGASLRVLYYGTVAAGDDEWIYAEYEQSPRTRGWLRKDAVAQRTDEDSSQSDSMNTRCTTLVETMPLVEKREGNYPLVKEDAAALYTDSIASNIEGKPAPHLMQNPLRKTCSTGKFRPRKVWQKARRCMYKRRWWRQV